MMNGLHENTHLLESLKLLIQEVMRWKKVQELKKGKKNSNHTKQNSFK